MRKNVSVGGFPGICSEPPTIASLTLHATSFYQRIKLFFIYLFRSEGRCLIEIHCCGNWTFLARVLPGTGWPFQCQENSQCQASGSEHNTPAGTQDTPQTFIHPSKGHRSCIRDSGCANTKVFAGHSSLDTCH